MTPTDCIEIIQILDGDLDKAKKIFDIIEKNYHKHTPISPDKLWNPKQIIGWNPGIHGGLMNDQKWQDHNLPNPFYGGVFV